MTTPLQIITRSLREVGAVGGGETPEPTQVNDAFDLLNERLDQLSNEGMMLFCKQEIIHELTSGQYIYSIGPGGSIGSTFNGTTDGSSVLTVNSMASGTLNVGQIVGGTLGAVGQISEVFVGPPGLGFLTNPSFSVSGGGGSGAVLSGNLGAIGLNSSFSFGSGYTPGDSVTLNGGVFTLPAVLEFMGGTAWQVVSPGAYTVLPGTSGTVTGVNVTGIGGSISVTGGTGSGFKPIIAWGVSSVTVVSPGANYSGVITITPSVQGNAQSAGFFAFTVDATDNVIAGTITSYKTGLGGQGVTALGTYNLNVPQPAGTTTLTSYMPRPLHIDSGFVRVNFANAQPSYLDYPIEILNVEQYERIGLKQLNGPWPRAVYYQPSEPLGFLNYWPNPSQGEMHLFADMLLNRFNTINDVIVFPQGYTMALQWLLAEMLMLEYPSTAGAQEIRMLIPRFAAEAKALIKRVNMKPIQTVQFDSILNSSRTQDAGWILHGGFR